MCLSSKYLANFMFYCLLKKLGRWEGTRETAQQMDVLASMGT